MQYFKLEINMHHLPKAIPAGPLSDYGEIFFDTFNIPKSVCSLLWNFNIIGIEIRA